jgi:hypothetical protein
MVRSFVRKCYPQCCGSGSVQKFNGSATLVTRYLKEALQVCAVSAALCKEAGAQRADDRLLGGQEAEQVTRSVPQRGQGETAPQVGQAAQEGGQVPLHTGKKTRLNIF